MTGPTASARYSRRSRRDGNAVVENGHVIAIQRDDAQITIEPGGQFELAARPITKDSELVTDLALHPRARRAFEERSTSHGSSIGLRPFGTRAASRGCRRLATT